jgi:hypothetical protein
MVKLKESKMNIPTELWWSIALFSDHKTWCKLELVRSDIITPQFWSWLLHEKHLTIQNAQTPKERCILGSLNVDLHFTWHQYITTCGTATQYDANHFHNNVKKTVLWKGRAVRIASDELRTAIANLAKPEHSLLVKMYPTEGVHSDIILTPEQAFLL